MGIGIIQRLPCDMERIQKHYAHSNHDVHLMAREIDEWMAQGINAMIDGSYTPRFLKRHYFSDEVVDQLYLSDRIFQHILLRQLKPTFPFVMNPNCYHLQGPSGVKTATQRIRQVLQESQPKYFIRADIKSFYKSIQHHKLIEDIQIHYDDPNVQAMLTEIIINPIETPRGYKNPDHGIALRGPLSQFFSGIFLKPLDDAFDSMDVTYIRYQDDILILCPTKRSLNRCKRRMMDVLQERRLSLSRKKTCIGSIEKGFHFLGIHYPGTRPLDNTKLTQVDDHSNNQTDFAHNSNSLGGGRQFRQMENIHLRLRRSFRMRERCVKHASKFNKWSKVGYLPEGSQVTYIVGRFGGVRHEVAFGSCFYQAGMKPFMSLNEPRDMNKELS